MENNNLHVNERSDAPSQTVLDEVTGVLNRGATMNSIETYLQGEGKNGNHALVMLDVDNFKTINDTLGHICGDAAINRIAQTALSQFRKDDIVGRVGGDEFFAFIKNVEAEGIRGKINELLRQLQFVITGNEKHIVTSVSAGIAMYYGDAPQPKTLKNLYSEADVALYRAKAAGKNTCAFAAQDIPAEAVNDIGASDSLAFNFSTLLNNLGVGIVIFHGRKVGELVPLFCNDGFLKLSGYSYEEFKTRMSQEYNYGVHPDDVEMAWQKFAEAYHAHIPFRHTLRVEMQHSRYHWYSVYGNIRYLEDGSFEAYMIFTDADKAMNDHSIDVRRYNSFLEITKQTADETLLTARANLTTNHCSVYFCIPQVDHAGTEERTLDEFIDDAHASIAYPDRKEEFIKRFGREALIKSYDEGRFYASIKLPILMHDKRVVWCKHSVNLCKNPSTGDLEGIIRLIDEDMKIRARDHFDRILEEDYEVVADINSETGLVTVISESESRGVPRMGSAVTHYMTNLRTRAATLVDSEFVEECIRATSLDTVKQKLKSQRIYTCSYPANSKLLGHDGVFQWRFGYVGKNNEDILFTRREMIGFLDSKHREPDEKSLAQAEKLLMGKAAKAGLAKRRNILIADDVDMNREMLRIIFEKDFGIIEAADGEEAIQLIDRHHDSLALILLDLQMPKKTGLDVLVHIKLRNLNDRIPVIMVTGSSSKDISLRSLEYGIADIINKPFDSKIVKRRSLNLIELYAHKEDVERQMRQWKEEAIRLHVQTEKNNEMLINTLSSVVEFRSLESGLHIKRVRAITETMLKIWTTVFSEDYFDDEMIAQISRASTLHDIGKIAIPDNILLKPGRLTPEEYDIMKKHTVFGCEMLEHFKEEDSAFYGYCYDICRHHHERSDGRGYPDGLVGDEIPIWAQIVSIVDVFDALISPRVYKPAYTPEQAVNMIRGGECGSFSEKLLTCFEAAKEQVIFESMAMVEKDAEGRHKA